MRKYSLASSDYKNTVNLLKYSKLIKNRIHSICPNITVIVESDGFLLPDCVSRGDRIRIGRLLANTELCEFCIERPSLFVGKNLDEQNTKEKPVKK